ncbi:hypothetical protein [Streptomyces sp. GbtcB6]|uniref:hypothetical protein n=1 Tax=Streptomyces sp. GbtcB6 TaxID=2824751 RepID=UPI001C301861|nr:hypothetical protein [Streptomyces sp. GbtcB6]
MRMRLSTALSLCLAAAAAVLAPAPSATAVPAVAGTSCAGADEPGFPLTTRLHDGPSSYEPGGGFGTWYLDLTNVTRRTCTDVHPVVVLVDDKRALKPSQTELEFYDGPRTRPVPLTVTDESELVGVFDGTGFPGFTVAPGATVSVKVRLAVTSDAVRNGVTANAAVVQRRGSDGEWVGESNDYRFGIGGEPPPPPASLAPAVPSGGVQVGPQVGPQTPPGASPESPGNPESSGSPAAPDTSPDTSPGASPGATPGVTPAASPGGSARPFTDEARGGRNGGDGWDGGDGGGPWDAEGAWAAGERARELARTGLGLAHGLFTAALALLTVGAGAFLLARRRR